MVDYDVDWDTSYYHGGRPISHVNFTDDASSSVGLECGDIENGQPDSDVWNYSVNRSISNDYRDSERSGDCDVFKTFAKLIYREEIGAARWAG